MHQPAAEGDPAGRGSLIQDMDAPRRPLAGLADRPGKGGRLLFHGGPAVRFGFQDRNETGTESGRASWPFSAYACGATRRRTQTVPFEAENDRAASAIRSANSASDRRLPDDFRLVMWALAFPRAEGLLDVLSKLSAGPGRIPFGRGRPRPPPRLHRLLLISTLWAAPFTHGSPRRKPRRPKARGQIPARPRLSGI